MFNSVKNLRSARLIRISSKEKTHSADSTTNFHVHMNQSDLHNIRHVSLKSIQLTNTAYNVPEGKNTLFYQDADDFALDNQKVVTVPAGQYDFTSLKDVIESALAGYGDDATITLDPVTKKIVFTWVATGRILGDSPIGSILGFTESTSLAAVLVADTMPNLAGLTKVYITSHALTHSSVLATGSKRSLQVLAEIDVDVPFGFTAYKQIEELHTQDEFTSEQGIEISTIDIQLYDQDLEPLDLNGSHVYITLRAYS